MIGRDRLDLAMLAYTEAGTTSFAAQMAGIEPVELAEWSHDATGPAFVDFLNETETDHSVRAGLLATGVLIGVTVGRQA